jgi:ribosome-binding factor A
MEHKIEQVFLIANGSLLIVGRYEIFALMSGTTRQQKYAKLIQKELSLIFQKDQRGILDNAFVTIADVRMNPDLSVAKVYISMLLAKEKEKVLMNINRRKSEIRKALGDKIGKQVRIIPELIFFKDELEESASKMDELIKNLKIPQSDK